MKEGFNFKRLMIFERIIEEKEMSFHKPTEEQKAF